MHAYEDNTFVLGKRGFNYKKMLRFDVPKDERPIMRALVLRRTKHRAGADGDRSLGYGDACIVGVRSRVASISLEATVRGLMEKHNVSEEELLHMFEHYQTTKKPLK